MKLSSHLLAVATQTRQYYLSADKAGPVPLSQVDQISRSLVNDFASIKREDLEALAKEYLSGSRAVNIGIIPEQVKAAK